MKEAEIYLAKKLIVDFLITWRYRHKKMKSGCEKDFFIPTFLFLSFVIYPIKFGVNCFIIFSVISVYSHKSSCMMFSYGYSLVA